MPLAVNKIGVFFLNEPILFKFLFQFLIFFHFKYRVRHLTFFFELVLISWKVTLSSCLIGQIISFILSPNKYGCLCVWPTLESGPILAKKNHFFRCSSFWSWRVCKQAKLSHVGYRKSARMHWKADASKISHCLVRILNQRHNWAIFEDFWCRGIIRTKQWIVLGASAFQCMRADFLYPTWDNFACLHTRQDQNELHLKICFFFVKIGIFCKSIAGPFPNVVQAYTQQYLFGERIKLIICQIRHELSVTIHEINTSWIKNVRWQKGPPQSL